MESVFELAADSQLENGGDFSLIELEKDASGLGFNISGGTDTQHLPGSDSPFISGIRPFSQAYVDGRINVGDRIVALNDVPLQNMTHQEIIEEFCKSGKRVKLLLDTGAEMRIVSEVSRSRSMAEPFSSRRTADYVNGLMTPVPSDPSPALDMTQRENSTKELATPVVAQRDKRSFFFSGAVCVSIGVALGAAAVVAFKVVRH